MNTHSGSIDTGKSAQRGSGWVGPAVALLFALAATLPLLLNGGFLNTRGGGDSPFLLFRLHQLLAALRQGVFPVRWMPDAALGLGYPFLSYYAALPYYLAAALKFFGLSYVASLKLTQLYGFGLAAWGMYRWTRTAGYTRPAAWLATAAYTFAPFHLVNVYVRGDSLSEFWAFAWYPVILLAALRLARRPSLRRAMLLSLAFAALLLTHQISALIFTPFLVLYLLVLLVTGNSLPVTGYRPSVATRSSLPDVNHSSPPSATFGRSRLRFILLASLSLALALALSAFFWLPALLEGRYGQLAPVTQGYFNYTQHFRGFNLIQGSFVFNYDAGSEKSTPFALGFVQADLMVFGLIALGYGAIRRRRTLHAGHEVFAVLGLAAATFMITPLSRGLWDGIPLLPFVQFPWRFLTVQSLFAALVTAGLVTLIDPSTVVTRSGQSSRESVSQRPAVTPRASRFTLRPAPLSLALGALLALTAMASLRLDFIPIADGDVSAQRLQLYEYFTGNLGTTIRYEYLPKWTVPRPHTSDDLLLREPRVKVLAGAASGARVEKGAASQRWTITVDSPQALVAVPLLYWPGWTARVDGRSVRVAAAPGLGWMAFVLPQGQHIVVLHLGRTALRAAAEIISLFAWLALAAIILRSFRQPVTGNRLLVTGAPLPMTSNRLPVTDYWSLVIAILFIVSSFLVALIAVPTPPSFIRLSADLDQLAYFSSAPIRFADGTRLSGYDYSADRVSRGGTTQITSAWADARGASLGNIRAETTASIELVSPAGAGRDQAVFATAQLAPAAAAVTPLTIPAAMPPGVYLLRLSLSAPGQPIPALTPSGQPRGAVYLRPIWIDDPGPASPPEPAGQPLAEFGPAVRLIGLTTSEATADALTLAMTWQALADVPQNYALAIRLRDPAGNELAALDTEPAHGFYPTGLWRPGEIVPDRLTLPLRVGAPPGEYQLSLALYEAASLAPVGVYGEQPAVLTIPTTGSAADVRFPLNDSLGLAGVDVPPSLLQGEALNVTARWVTLQTPPPGWQAQWSLTDASGTNAYSKTIPLSAVAAPEAWSAGSLIHDRANLTPPPAFTPGKYTLALTLLDAHGEALATTNNLGIVEVLKRERLTSVPDSAQRLEATFGDALELRAYDFDYNSRKHSLTLTPYWSARVQPGRSYKYFVHVFDPKTEAIVAQADDFPRASTYPTTKWTPGEVVSDTITISLDGIDRGKYRVAVGWYDPEDPQERLRARDANGSPLDQDRVVLPEEIKVK